MAGGVQNERACDSDVMVRKGLGKSGEVVFAAGTAEGGALAASHEEDGAIPDLLQDLLKTFLPSDNHGGKPCGSGN